MQITSVLFFVVAYNDCATPLFDGPPSTRRSVRVHVHTVIFTFIRCHSHINNRPPLALRKSTTWEGQNLLHARISIIMRIAPVISESYLAIQASPGPHGFETRSWIHLRGIEGKERERDYK